MHADNNLSEQVRRATVTMRMTVIGLIAGPAIYLWYTLARVGGINVPQPGAIDPKGVGTGLGFGVVAFSVGWLMVDMLLGTGRRRQLANSLHQGPRRLRGTLDVLAHYQVRLIVRLAIFDGAAFYNVYCFSLLHSWVNLAVAVVLIVSMVLCWPTTSGVLRWVEKFAPKESQPDVRTD